MGTGRAERLTRREREVAAQVAKGLSNKEIARTLFIGVRTAESHVANILGKLGLGSRAELVAHLAAGKLQPVAVPGNLPEPLSTFIGREWEAATVLSLLGRSRLVTITGAGGIGKSRLALEVARRIAPDLLEGPWLIELAAISDPGLVATAMLATLGLRENVGSPPEAILLEALQKGRALLLIDNCEHLLTGVVGLVSSALSRCPGVRVLATSRTPLAIDGEAIVSLEGLNLSPGTGSHEETAPAIRLFLDRAQLKRAGFEPSASEIADIGSLCRRLDGMPLAIELAAAWVSAMTPSEMLTRIERGYSLPAAKYGDSSRHRTIDAAIEWSYTLLSEEERAVFRGLSVFSGFGLEAAAAICGAPPHTGTPVDELVLSLVDKSLVLAVPQKERTRYRLLEPVRQFAWDKLALAGGVEAVRRRHANHYAEIGECAMPELVGVHKGSFWQPILDDLDNFRSALAWAAEHDPAVELRLVVPFWHALGITSRLREQWAMVEHALSVAREPSRARVHLLSLAAWTHMTWGQHQQTEQFAQQELDLARVLKLKKEEIQALYTLSSAQIPLSAEKAEKTAREAVALTEHVDDRKVRQLAMMALAWALAGAGKIEEAIPAFDESIALLRELDDLFLLPSLLEGRANLALMLDDCDLAARYWSEGAKLCRELGYRYHLPFCIDGLARVARKRGDMERSLRLAAAASQIFRENQMKDWGADRPSPEEWVSEVRRLLPRHQADKAWTEGERMTDDEAIRYATESGNLRSDVAAGATH